MNQLLFIVNELLNPDLRRKMRLPMEFICFGIMPGKMYPHYHDYRARSVFIVKPTNKLWGNDVVYGALMLCKDFDFYARILDAYHVCSLSTMRRNHKLDMHHRVNVKVTPIYFNSLDELSRLMYTEGDVISVQTYLGNPLNHKISQRLNANQTCRIIDGIDKINYIKLWEEEYEKENNRVCKGI
jgi:hypothetical protein